MTCDPPCEPVSKYYSIVVILPPRRKIGANSNAGFTAETLVAPLCNSMHVAAKLVRSKHIPVMPKQALLTAAHFSCALKFNSVPTNPAAARSPSPTTAPQQRLFVDKRDLFAVVKTVFCTQLVRTSDSKKKKCSCAHQLSASGQIMCVIMFYVGQQFGFSLPN